MPRVLIADDDSTFARRVQRNLELDGYDSEIATDGSRALQALGESRFDALLCDVRMPGMTGLEVLAAVRAGTNPGIDSSLPVIMLTSVGTVETAVESMRGGASDFLTKEASRAEIAMRLRRALGQRQLVEENERLRQTIARVDEFSDLIGTSAAILRIKAEIAEVGPTTATVAILGETGTGKELVARALHAASGRRGPFVDLNAAMLPEDNLLQSELFGHERGAFTDAHQAKKGKFEVADGGTLFLDEIGELTREVQAKLLRVLETLTFTRVGGTKPIRVDVRLIVATNRDLRKDVDAGTFRDDLYYRLNVFPISLPPLREHREDIAPLAAFFLSRHAARYGRHAPAIAPAAMQLMTAANWPGNVRELRNICERLLIRVRGGTEISAADVRACGVSEAQQSVASFQFPDSGVDLEDFERTLVVEALRRAEWNQTEAARLLNISVDRMNNRVKKYNLSNPKWRVHKGSDE